ncbi:hypothetical protein HDG34_002514 [Paraburkholderia sp. HC6.4b]|uniref:hypothetical protein n=1 Tax=unclassified Paraburkholderia TaxID=2615204 RepID=UPI0016179F7E|nr:MULTISPECIES: hypothetical protein [unclassified Paraburkholderia]MBB5408577.1 hypothetical protein [Paraburkholderia sp. HC6.4b]MBB5450409.1 hypothetical protein [Paraburkholderia sp. Kb1A]
MEPKAAIPEAWVVSLFARMQAIFGARFSALWADADLDLVKRVWGEALAQVQPDDMRRAVMLLPREKRPPDLPRFLELCEPVPVAQRASFGPARLPLFERADAATVDTCMTRMRDGLAPLAGVSPSPQWAFDMLLRGTAHNGRPLGAEARRIATDAVVSAAGRACVADAPTAVRARYRAVFEAAYRARGGVPPSRVPGEDDEEPQEATL